MPRVTEANQKRPQMETMQIPRERKISCPVLGIMSIQEKYNAINRVAERRKTLFHQKKSSPNQNMKYLPR